MLSSALLRKVRYYFACSVNVTDLFLAKVLEQLQTSSPVVPIEIYAQAKGKEPPTDAFPKMVKLYTSLGRVGTVIKESPSGKMIDEWNRNIKDAEKKPELEDISSSISGLMATKDEEELVCLTESHRKHILSFARNACAPRPT